MKMLLLKLVFLALFINISLIIIGFYTGNKEEWFKTLRIRNDTLPPTNVCTVPSPNSPPEQGERVILFTRYRSGSSFIGQLLNQHPDIYYIFEPFKMFVENIHSTTHYIHSTTHLYLEQVLACKLKPIIQDAKTMNALSDYTARTFCQKYPNAQCSGISIEKLEDKCIQYKHTAAKTISITKPE